MMDGDDTSMWQDGEVVAELVPPADDEAWLETDPDSVPTTAIMASSMQSLVNSSSSSLGAVAGIGSFKRLVSTAAAVGGGGGFEGIKNRHLPRGGVAAKPEVTLRDLQRIIFRHDRDRRTVSGLLVHHSTRQQFVSSFSVGLAIGSIVAILFKVFKDVVGGLFF